MKFIASITSSESQVDYFDKMTFKQIKDAAKNVLKKVESMSLSEMFSRKLKFTTSLKKRSKKVTKNIGPKKFTSSNTDSTCLKFVFLSDPESNIDKKIRDIIVEVIVASKSYKRFDSSNPYWGKFGTRRENFKKCLGYFEIEHINNSWFVTVAVNPKAYYKYFKDNSFNKKQKGIKKAPQERIFRTMLTILRH